VDPDRAVFFASEEPPAAAAPRAPERATPTTTPGRTLEFDLDGMRCASCVSSIESAICALLGVAAANVSLLGKSARVQLAAEDAASAVEIEAAIAKAGFQAVEANSREGSFVSLKLSGASLPDQSACEDALAHVEGIMKVELVDDVCTVYFSAPSMRRPLCYRSASGGSSPRTAWTVDSQPEHVVPSTAKNTRAGG